MLSYTSPRIVVNKISCSRTVHPMATTRVKMSRNEVDFCRTNVMADYIERFTNDINVVATMEQDDSNDYTCKYVAMFNCIIIIIILIFMFIDRKDEK